MSTEQEWEKLVAYKAGMSYAEVQQATNRAFDACSRLPESQAYPAGVLKKLIEKVPLDILGATGTPVRAVLLERYHTARLDGRPWDLSYLAETLALMLSESEPTRSTHSSERHERERHERRSDKSGDACKWCSKKHTALSLRGRETRGDEC